ncbi:hypothetical protein WQ57_09750 [Mesobacillus campisalis]|uniref:Uncharacterized protein n=1 Tax=Mesobacillus campisalis TaxID=1408103 RepID=A0A0M2SYP5_9BACI|nr:hypothetical protein [Mesobacillus campisalis]KKK38097.1 hypothetical protein WQ57_09750 [Mesobacillus campisalis]
MYKLEFIDHSTNRLFREKSFITPREMHQYLNKFNLKEDAEFTFFDDNLSPFSAVFHSLNSFVAENNMGFRMYFNCRLEKSQII